MTSSRYPLWTPRLRYADARLWIMQLEGTLDFDPTAHGLDAGEDRWVRDCSYVVEDGVLFVEGAVVSLTPGEVGRLDLPWGPRLAGHPLRPIRDLYNELWGEATGLHLPVDYSGRLLACAEPVDGYYHLPAYAFARVLELEFKDGRLCSVADRSEAVRAFREGVPPNPDFDGKRIATTRDAARLRECFAGQYPWRLVEPVPRWRRLADYYWVPLALLGAVLWALDAWR